MICDVVCRMIEYMRQSGYTVVMPTLSEAETDMPRLPYQDESNFNAGYALRSQHLMFRQGDREPWKHGIEYEDEIAILPAVKPDDAALADQ